MSFSFWQKRISILVLFSTLVSCQSLRTRDEVKKGSGEVRPTVTAPSVPVKEESEEVAEVGKAPSLPPPPPPTIPSLPKIGLILGPGGAKTYAHIGFLHELAKARVPLHAIGGVEFAAPMAALFADKEQANQVEWQMFKLKDEDVLKKSLLGSSSKNSEISGLKNFISAAFGRMKLEDSRIPFACPSYNLKKNQVYLMNRGGVEQLMYSCMAYPPYFQPFQGSVAGVRDISALASYLRSKGANYIVLVNVLQPPVSGTPLVSDTLGTDNVLWSEIAGSYNRPLNGVDTVISLETSAYGIVDFDKRREIMGKGAESGSRQLKTLVRKWGF